MSLRCPRCGAKGEGPALPSGDWYCPADRADLDEAGHLDERGDYTPAFFADSGPEAVPTPDGRLLPRPEYGAWICTGCWRGAQEDDDACPGCGAARTDAAWSPEA